MTDDPMITARDASAAFCLPGIKHFCASTGLDFHTLVTDGYPASVLLATGDVRCQEFVTAFLEEVRDGQQ